MARFYREYQEAREQNPLLKIYTNLYQIILQEAETLGAEFLFDGIMSASQYTCYLLFESVAQKMRNTLEAEAVSIHGYLSHFSEDDPFILGDYLVAAKRVSNDFSLRKDFHFAEIGRLSLPLDSEITLEYQKMRDRSALHGGYNLTLFQLEQLHDQHDFCIQRKNRFRQFQSSKHTTNNDVIAFYASLVEHAQNCKVQNDIKLRVIQAVNLNDFENKNICVFLYHLARYCANNKISIKELDEAQKTLLSYITAVISYEQAMVVHKPVLMMKEYIEPAIQRDEVEISRLINLELWGLHFRLSVLPSLLDKSRYTYEDINQFFLSGPVTSSYNTYKLYTTGFEWDDKTISNLRALIGLLTIDPLSK